MDSIVHSGSAPSDLDTLLEAVSFWARTAQRNESGDAGETRDALNELRRHGVLTSVLPRRLGGLGLGTEPAGAEGVMSLLYRIGTADLSLGRIVEGHINAVQLILRYGGAAQAEATARSVFDGHLHAIWNTEAPPGVRRLASGRLSGRKSHCSAAGIATRGLITVDQNAAPGARMLVIRLRPGERRLPIAGVLHGMRATRPGAIDLEDYQPEDGDWIGQAGDYLREPLFSGGAWRTLAVILGGLDTLVAEIGRQLKARRRDQDAQQQGRVAAGMIAAETARLWVRECARMADGSDYGAPGIAGYVALARRAVEAACLDTLQLAQRSIGMAAFLDSNPIEGLMRDLATYLRQPALDEGLREAAARFLEEAQPRAGGAMA